MRYIHPILVLCKKMLCGHWSVILNKHLMIVFIFKFSFYRMPLKNSERQKKWREKKTKELGKQLLNEKEKKRWEKRRQDIKKNEIKDREFKIIQAKKKAKSRVSSKKLEKSNNLNILSVGSAFSTVASRNRSVKRAKDALPVDINQKKEVVKILFEQTIEATPGQQKMINHMIKIDDSSSTSRPGGRKITNEIAEKLKMFLDCSDISYNVPGREHQLYMGKVNGDFFKQKKYIIHKYNQLHSLIQKHSDPDLSNLKFSTIFRFIRDNKDYVGCSKISHITCLCPECENIVFLP